MVQLKSGLNQNGAVKMAKKILIWTFALLFSILVIGGALALFTDPEVSYIQPKHNTVSNNGTIYFIIDAVTTGDLSNITIFMNETDVDTALPLNFTTREFREWNGLSNRTSAQSSSSFNNFSDFIDGTRITWFAEVCIDTGTCIQGDNMTVKIDIITGCAVTINSPVSANVNSGNATDGWIVNYTIVDTVTTTHNSSLWIDGLAPTYNASEVLIGASESNVFASQRLNNSESHTLRIQCDTNATEMGTASSIQTITKDRFFFFQGEDNKAFYASDAYEIRWYTNDTLIAPLIAPFNFTAGQQYHLYFNFDNTTNTRSIIIDGTSIATDSIFNAYGISASAPFYIGSDNQSQGQIDGIYDIFAIYNRGLLAADRESRDTWTTTYISDFKDFINDFTLETRRYLQYLVILTKGAPGQLLELNQVNVSYETASWNVEILPANVDYFEIVNTSSTFVNITPIGQTTSIAMFRINNTGGDKLNISVRSDAAFDSCFNVALDDSATRLAPGVETLSTSYQDVNTSLAAGQSVDIWTWVSATSCTSYSEMFNIEFRGITTN